MIDTAKARELSLHPPTDEQVANFMAYAEQEIRATASRGGTSVKLSQLPSSLYEAIKNKLLVSGYQVSASIASGPGVEPYFWVSW